MKQTVAFSLRFLRILPFDFKQKEMKHLDFRRRDVEIPYSEKNNP